MFSRRILNLKSSVIKEIAAAIKEDSSIISLAQGLPSFSTPNVIRETVAKGLLEDEKGIGAYSLYSGTRSLKKLIAEKLQNEFKSFNINKNINWQKEIFVTVGAMEGLSSCILSIVNAKDEVILPTPNYPSHITQIRLAQAKPVFVSLKQEPLANASKTKACSKFSQRLLRGSSKSTRRASQSGYFWTWDLEDIKKAISKKTKMILLTNPGNPTGCVFNFELLKSIVKLSKENNIWILADETYAFLTYDGLSHNSLGLFRNKYDKLIVIRSFSKEYAMTGWRLGYVYALPELVKNALKVHEALVGCPSTISQKGALIALQSAKDKAKEFKRELDKRRILTAEYLNSLSEYFEYAAPLGSYYFWVKIKDKSTTSVNFALNLLREAKVAVVPGSAFGPTGKGYFRICFAVSKEEIKEGMKRIRKFLC